MGERENFTSRAARWSAAHRKGVTRGWLAFVLAAFAIGSVVGVVALKQGEGGNGQSERAEQIQASQFPRERSREQVLIENPSGPLAGTPYRAAVTDLLARLSHTPSVVAIRSPLAPGNIGQLSRNGRAALVIFGIGGDPDSAPDRVGPALAATAAVQRAYPHLFIGELGDASSVKAVNATLSHDFHSVELTSLPVTLAILVLAFGALVAAGLPLLLGFTAVFATLGLTDLFSHVLHVWSGIDSVIFLIGLAVGIDYSLFYLRRVRQERAAGRTPAAALQVAAATSGRAVLISGLIVMIAMAGMCLMGSQIFTAFGIGSVLVVAVALVGSLTVLPAVIARLGDRVDRGHVPGLKRLRARAGESRFWAKIVGAVLRKPVLLGGAALALLVALAIPAFSLHTVEPGLQGLPHDMPIMKVYRNIQAGFPGGATPEVAVISAPDVTSPAVTAGIAALEHRALATGQMFEPISVGISVSHRAARVSIPLAGTGTNAASVNALATLRNSVIPATIGRVPGVSVATEGETGSSVDFNESMKSHAPFVFVWVLGLAFLLLLVTFRSLVIPLTAIILNLLSVGAAYGVLVLVFQQGHLQSLLHFTSVGGITSWIPLFLFVILFGLSMDYHVFILSRVREGHDDGMSTEDAVAHGIKATAGVVTSAAIVMVAVFAIFASLEELTFKIMGVGLGVAILLDATIVRAVLLPATMKLLGDWNWYLPSWLEWMPRVSVEVTSAGRSPSPAPAASARAAAAPRQPARLRLSLHRH
jgi:uncharacterized membrane protein YdfJ with MMPL/SSD domain